MREQAVDDDIWFTFSPFWLFTREEEDAKLVQNWLKSVGLDLEKCPGFDLDPIGNLITTRYYEMDHNGRPMMDTHGNPKYEDQVREFPAGTVPDVVRNYLNA